MMARHYLECCVSLRFLYALAFVGSFIVLYSYFQDIQKQLNELRSTQRFTVQSFNERFEDFEIRLAGGTSLWNIDNNSSFIPEEVDFLRYKTNKSTNITHQGNEGFCSWQDLSTHFSGIWLPRHDAITQGLSFLGTRSTTYSHSCDFISKRYLCFQEKLVRHESIPLYFDNFVWVPELAFEPGTGCSRPKEKACEMHENVTLRSLQESLTISGRTTNYSIFFHGNSLLKEFIESILCQFQADITQVITVGSGNNNVKAFFSTGLSFHYMFRDYDLRETFQIYKGVDLNKQFDLYVTNYGAEFLKTSVEKMNFNGDLFLLECSIRDASHREVIDLNRKLSSLGVPFLSLSEMARQAKEPGKFDPLVASHNRNAGAGDPHACLPGIHDTAVMLFLHMLASVVA